MALEKYVVALPGGKTKFSRAGIEYNVATLDDATAEMLMKRGCMYIKPAKAKPSTT